MRTILTFAAGAFAAWWWLARGGRQWIEAQLATAAPASEPAPAGPLLVATTAGLDELGGPVGVDGVEPCCAGCAAGVECLR